MNASGVFDAPGGLGTGSSQFAELFSGDRSRITNPEALGLLLAGMCTGILTLLAVLISAFQRKFPRKHLTGSMVILLFTSVCQVLSSSVVLVNLQGHRCSWKYCPLIYQIWYASRRFGVLLHLMVALEYFVKKSPFGFKMLGLYLALPVVLLLGLVCLVFFNVPEASIFVGAFAANMMCLLIVLAFLFNTGDKKRSVNVLVTAIITFWVTYFPSFVLECILDDQGFTQKTFDLYWIFLCLTNLRPMMDGYLCLVICTHPPQEAPQQLLDNGDLDLDSVSEVKD